MPVTYTNRKGQTYYLHAGTTRRGKARYWFSTRTEGDLVDSIPEGYEIYENPEAQVFLRRIVPQLVSPLEIATVKKGLERYAPGENCIVDVKGEDIIVNHAERVTLDLGEVSLGFRELPPFYRNYVKVMRFTLVDAEARTFRVQRWCFRGSIDKWIDLWFSGSRGNLSELVKKFCPHIGKESFYELM
jgi:hypothetical protein